MPQTPYNPTPLTAERSPWLRGPVRVPGERGVSRLALLLAAMARGESVIEHLSSGPEISAMIAAIRQLGATVQQKAGNWHVRGIGTGGFIEPEAPIDLGTMGDGATLLIGVLAAHDFEARFVHYIPTSVSEALLDFLRRSGGRISQEEDRLTVRAARFGVPLDLALPPEALALKAPLLLHALTTSGNSILHLPASGGDPAEALMEAFGAKIVSTPEETGIRLTIGGLGRLHAHSFVVAGDPVMAAYPAVAALIAPDSEITVETLAASESRMAVLQALQRLGGNLKFEPAKKGGSEAKDLVITHGKLKGARIPESLAIEPEDFTILAIAAAFAEGDTLLEGVGEGPRRLALTRALRANRIECEERPGGLLIRGAQRVPGGGHVTTRLDAKLGMAFLVLGLGADKPVTIDDGAVMRELYPEFIKGFEHVGASLKPGIAP